MKSLLLIVVIAGLVGCASTGNPAITSIQPAHIQGLTKAQLVEKYGPPTIKQFALKDGHVTEVYVWSYAAVAFGKLETLSVSIAFDGDDLAASVTGK